MKFAASAIIASLIIAFTFHSCITPRRGPQKAFNNAIGLKPFDAIIVPGIPFKNGGWDSVMKARVLWSYILFKHGYARNIIYSGAAVYSPYKEAVIMGLYAQELGIPAKNIFYDTLAKHSTENVYYSYLLAQKIGFKSLALATDPFQSFVLRSFTRRRFQTPIYLLPFITDSLARYNYLNPHIEPATAKVNNFEPLPEKENFFQRLKGTLGSDIDWSQYEDGRLGPL